MPPAADDPRISLYRLAYFTDYHERFCDVLEGIRPGENKIRRIEPGQSITRVDVTIYEEELLFLKLSIPRLMESWLQMWDENDRH